MNLIWPHQTLGSPHTPALIFLHGFMGTGSDWRPIARRCVPHFFCILPDLPGHGQNCRFSPAEPLDFARIATGLQQLMSHLQLERANLVGYSMGGRLALYTATQFPQRISRLILESASPGLADSQARQARATADDDRAATLLKVGLEEFIDHWYTLPLFNSLQQQPALLAQAKTQRLQNQPGWMAKIIRDLSPGRQPPLWDQLGDLSLPVLLLAGALDPKYSALIPQMAQKIAGAQAKIVATAGHNIHLEQPDLFANTLLKFLNAS